MLTRDGEILANLPIKHDVTVNGKRIVLFKSNGIWQVWVK